MYKYCSPSRSSLLSGRYPFHLAATRCNLIPSSIPEGLDLGYTLLPKHLARAGYVSRHVGKWHLGFHTDEYTPVGRGFNSSYGFLQGGEDHWTHECGAGETACHVPWRPKGTTQNFDLWRQTEQNFPGDALVGLNGTKGDLATYSGYIFTAEVVRLVTTHKPSDGPLFIYWALHNTHAPIEAPQRFLDLYPQFEADVKKQTFSAMVSVVDESVANVTSALHQSGMWEQTLFVWTTDNGSPIQVAGSNHPYRGGKGTNWEGGVRVPTFVTGGVIPVAMRGKRLDGLVHVADWFSTFSELAGLGPHADPAGPAPSASLSMWAYLSGSAASSPRSEIVLDHYMFDNETSSTSGCVGQRWFEMPGRASLGALRQGKWKLIVGPNQEASWYGAFSPNTTTPPDLSPIDCWDHCLFDMETDATEHVDVAADHPDVTAAMLKRFTQLESEYHPPVAPPAKAGEQFCATVREHDGWVAPNWFDAEASEMVEP